MQSNERFFFLFHPDARVFQPNRQSGRRYAEQEVRHDLENPAVKNDRPDGNRRVDNIIGNKIKITDADDVNDGHADAVHRQ